MGCVEITRTAQRKHHLLNAAVYGNRAYGTANTYYGGQSVLLTGTHDQDLNVLMLRKGERGYKSAISAKQVLGENWKEIAAKGITTCT